MTPAALKRSLGRKEPPAGLTPALTALWWAGKNDWSRVHELVMEAGGVDCAWIHAHLHRAEGDLANANYWYRRARRQPAEGELQAEWTTIVAALLKRGA